MLTAKQRANLKSIAAKFADSVIIGKGGLTDTVLKEIDTALYHKELAKVSVLKNSGADAKEIASAAAEKLAAECVQVIGGKFVLYKYSDKKDIEHITF